MSIHLLTPQSWANTLLIRSIHANAFTPFTRIVATKMGNSGETLNWYVLCGLGGLFSSTLPGSFCLSLGISGVKGRCAIRQAFLAILRPLPVMRPVLVLMGFTLFCVHVGGGSPKFTISLFRPPPEHTVFLNGKHPILVQQQNYKKGPELKHATITYRGGMVRVCWPAKSLNARVFKKKTFLEAGNPPQIPKYQKTPRLHKLFRKVRANFCLLPCDTSQGPNRDCSEKLVQMSFFILGAFFRVGFHPVNSRLNAFIFHAFHAKCSFSRENPILAWTLFSLGHFILA